METIIDNARKVLGDAEVRLRDFIAEAARGADYDAIRQLSPVAERLLALCGELASPRTTTGDAALPVSAKSPKRGERATGAVGRPMKGAYPRYERHKGTLWRVGWSKKERGEYVHKVPRDSFDRIVSALATLAKNGARLITVEQMIKHASEFDGADIPAYHAYVALGLLGRDGHVEKHGRDGYQVVEPDTVIARARQAWDTVGEEA